MVLERDQREAPRGFVAEVTRCIDRDAGRDRAEQQKKESREPVEAQVKRQVREPERQRQLVRGDPQRLEAVCCERQARQGTERKREAARKERIAGRDQREQADRQPAGYDCKRTYQR